MKNLNQLLLNFNHKQNFNYSDFYVSKSNYYAFQLIEKWPDWEKNILNIYGEKFSGKTHLSNIFLYKNKGIKVDEKDINDDLFKKLKLYENIVIDNYYNQSNEKLMYSIFNLVDQDNKYLIINSTDPINEASFKLNDLKSRVQSSLNVGISLPTDDLISVIIAKNFSDKQIKVEKKHIDYIIKRIDRSYEKISQFILTLDKYSLKKGSPFGLKLIKEVLKMI